MTKRDIDEVDDLDFTHERSGNGFAVVYLEDDYARVIDSSAESGQVRWAWQKMPSVTTYRPTPQEDPVIRYLTPEAKKRIAHIREGLKKGTITIKETWLQGDIFDADSKRKAKA